MKTSILLKLLMDSNQILQNYKIHKVLFVGGFNVHQMDPKWQMAPILQKN